MVGSESAERGGTGWTPGQGPRANESKTVGLSRTRCAESRVGGRVVVVVVVVGRVGVSELSGWDGGQGGRDGIDGGASAWLPIRFSVWRPRRPHPRPLQLALSPQAHTSVSPQTARPSVPPAPNRSATGGIESFETCVPNLRVMVRNVHSHSPQTLPRMCLRRRHSTAAEAATQCGARLAPCPHAHVPGSEIG